MTGPRPKRRPSETTPLSSLDELRFQAWARRNKITDVDHPDSHYDYRGAFATGVNPAPDGHWPDTFKQHGHPTFSVESQYSKGAWDGGHWNGETFVPSVHQRMQAAGAVHEPSPSAQGKGSTRTYLLGELLGGPGAAIKGIVDPIRAQAEDIKKLVTGHRADIKPDWDHAPTLGEIGDLWKRAISTGIRNLAEGQPKAVGNALFQGATLAAPGAKGTGAPQLQEALASERGAVPLPGTGGRGFAVEGTRATPAVPTNRAAAVEDMQALSRRLNYAHSRLGDVAPPVPGQGLPPAGTEPGLRPLTGTERGFEVTGARATPPAPSEGGNMSLEDMQALTRRLEYARRNPPAPSLPKKYAILTAENPGGAPASAAENARAMDQLRIRLQVMGREGVPTKGAYVDAGNLLHENGIMVPGMSASEAKQVAQSFGQNSVITHEGFHDLTTGKTTPISGIEHGVAAEAPYTELPGGHRFRMSFDQPATPLSDVVANYRQRAGITSEPLTRVKAVDAEAGARMAKTYEGLKNDPQNPEVRAAYKAFTDETASQAQALRDAGYSWDYVDKDPYKNSAEMLKDLRDNHHINVLKTDPASGHPLMTPDENNLFRAVHDIIGHGVEGNSFGAPGEENAFRGHAATYSPLAQRAMATETRGQNSWFNYGPHKDLPASQRPFATQKAALWPTEQLGEYPSADVPAFEENAPPPATLPAYVGAKMPKGDLTRLGESLAHHLAGAPDQGSWLTSVTKENPFLGRMLRADPSLADRVFKVAAEHQDFVNNLLPYSDIAQKAAAGGPAWDNWYGPYVKALRDAGVPEETVQRVLKTSTILSTRKAPVDEVLTALRTWQAHEAGEPITTQTTQHTNDLTKAAAEAIQGGGSWARNPEGTLRLRQKTSNYLLSELTGGQGEAPTLDTWHARAYLGPNISKYLDAKGNLDLTDPQWRVMQARTLADASRAQLPNGDFQARVWGGENGYVPSYGESGANRADLLAQHLGGGDFNDLIGRYPGLADLATEGRAATEAFGSEAERESLARQKQLNLFAYLRNR